MVIPAAKSNGHADIEPPMAEPEPWYYAHLHNYARLLKLSVSFAVWGGFALLCLLTVAVGRVYSTGSMELEWLVFWLLTLWTVGLIVIYVYRFFALMRACTIFLSVDEARNIRRTRIKAER